MLLSSAPSEYLDRLVETLRVDFEMNLNEFSRMFVTGGGSFKFSKELHDIFVSFSTVDEMNSVVKGAFFVLEQFSVKESLTLNYPILLANVGTGASFILIEEGKKFKRVGGTNLAGGTMNGILFLSDQSKSIKNVSSFIESGNKNMVDILVRDIYGSSYSSVGLNGDIVAGSLGKINYYNGQNLFEDVSASSAFMICSNLVHLLYLYSTIHGALSLFFGGSFPSIPAISNLLKNMTAAKFSDKVETKILDYGGFLGCFGIVSEILSEQ